MRKLALALILLGPFLVANPYSGADYFVITGLPVTMDASHVPPDETGVVAFKFDVSALPIGGPYTVTAKACSNIWGCSDESPPFVFVRPDVSNSPVNIRLMK